MNRKVLAYLREMALLQPGDHVICAVSGGKDSMALLHMLLELAPQLQITVSAAHLDHQLRGAESKRDAEFVSAHCQALGIPCAMEKADVSAYAAQHHLGIEEAARLLRYAFLEQLDPNAKIATAHTADDNLETVLMHLIRGSGLHGLTGIPPVRGPIIRPLLPVTRREIEDYLNANHIPHVEDSSNAQDDYLRNRLRHQVLPLLQAENPAIAESVTHLSHSLRLEDSFMEREAAARLATAQEGNRLSLTAFLQESAAMQFRMLRQFFAPVGTLSRRHLDAAHKLCLSDAPSGTLDLPGGYQLRREYDHLLLCSETTSALPPAPVIISGEGTYSFGLWTVTCTRGPAPEQLPADTVALSTARLRLPLCLRSYKTGDRIHLSGGTKKLSRLYVDEKIPAPLRPYMPVVLADDTIAAALPLRSAKEFSPAPGEDSLLLCAVKKET